MKAVIAQLNLLVGDLKGNAAKILDAALSAAAVNADLLLTSELSICSYQPEDLLLKPSFIAACKAEVEALAEKLPPKVAAIVGLPWRDETGLYNAAAVLRGGKIEAIYRKMELPNYSVFDDKRYFEHGSSPTVVEIGGLKVGVLICEDVWLPRAAANAKSSGAQVLAVINGSPYDTEHLAAREAACKARATEQGLPILFANLVGGQDEIIYDGQSFVMNSAGEVTQRLPGFVEATAVVEFNGGIGKNQPKPVRYNSLPSTVANVYSALVLGVKDYINKNRFPGIVLGLSGGIDSAIVLAIAVDALGRDRVRCVMLPSKFNADISLEDARWMAGVQGIRYDEIPIEPVYEAFEAALADQFKAFFGRLDTFGLGVCNGCQMFAELANIIPGAENWPRFTTNQSERFEARLSMVEVLESPSLFFAGLAGSRLPIAVAHGEGYANFKYRGDATKAIAAMRFTDNHGAATEAYPFNPNGSPGGLTAVTTADGRFTAMMPHPERVFRNVQMSWTTGDLSALSPWMQLWVNARRWIG